MAVAHRVNQSDCAAREGSLRIEQTAVPRRDALPVQREPGLPAADRGHGVAHQKQLAGRGAAVGNADAGGVHMVTVSDDAQPAVLAVQGGASDTRFAGAQGAHGVEQVGEAAQAVLPRLAQLLPAGCAVTGADDNAGTDELAYHAGRHRLRCQGDQAAEVGQAAQPVHVLLCRPAQAVRPMGAAARGGKEWSFDMNTENGFCRRLRRRPR